MASKVFMKLLLGSTKSVRTGGQDTANRAKSRLRTQAENDCRMPAAPPMPTYQPHIHGNVEHQLDQDQGDSGGDRVTEED